MENNDKVQNNDIQNDKVKIDRELADVIKLALKSSKNTKNVDQKILKEEILEHQDFLRKLNEINIMIEDRVIYTDGDEQLLYVYGEFYIIDTVTGSKKKKISKKEARDLYIEYFITYILNPMIEKKNVQKIKEDILKEDKSPKKAEKEKEKPKAKSEVKKKIEKIISKKQQRPAKRKDDEKVR